MLRAVRASVLAWLVFSLAACDGQRAPDSPTADDDLTAAGVVWDLEPLLHGAGPDELLDRAEGLIDQIEAYRGKLASIDAEHLATLMRLVERYQQLIGRVGSYAGLRFSEDTQDPTRGALMARVQERATTQATRLLFLELEWVEVPDERAERLLVDERLAFCAHHLRTQRRYRDHVLTEPEERVLTETSVAGATAWVPLPL